MFVLHVLLLKLVILGNLQDFRGLSISVFVCLRVRLSDPFASTSHFLRKSKIVKMAFMDLDFRHRKAPSQKL